MATEWPLNTNLVALAKPLTNLGNNHSGHSGHPEQGIFGANRERCDSSSAENSASGLARKVASVDCGPGLLIACLTWIHLSPAISLMRGFV
jgi:hypothetical protein